MVANPRGLYMSVEEYLALDSNSLDGRYEYIDGYVYMLAGGTANHSIIGGNLITTLNSLLQSNSCAVYTSDMRVRISKKRYVYPDVTVSCDPRDLGEVNTLEHPILVFEVLSASTEAYDRGRKFSYYRSCPTIQEYVLIDTQQQSVEVFRRETENLWTLHTFSSGDTVELVSINVRFPVGDLYRNVALPDE